MRKRVDSEPILLIQTMWADTFKLPMNDERLMALTPREALTQVLAIEALAQRREEARKRAMKGRRMFDLDEPPTPGETKRDSEAQKLADTPHLTGDPEWDAVELAETDPSKAPLTMKA